MEPIESFAMVLRYLKDQEIVLLRNRTSFHLNEGRIVVHDKNARFVLTIEEFTMLYQELQFYLYKPDENGIDSEKDEEYYRWKAKGVN